MGRPKGSLNKKTLEKMHAGLTSAPAVDPMDHLSDDEVLNSVKERFEMLYKLGMGAANGAVRGLIVSGAPGIGKTHTLEFLVEQKAETDPSFRYTTIKGAVTAINLYKTLFRYRDEGNVIILDDTDSIFFDDEGLAILKAALDSGDRRKLSWLSNSADLKNEGIDTEFEYHGSMMFITNTDFQRYVDERTSRLAPHFEALISRSIYLDLKIHSRRPIVLWAEFIVKHQKMLQLKMGLTDTQSAVACDYIRKNIDNLRSLSIREYLKVGQFMKTSPSDWKRLADMVLLRTSI